MLRIIHKKGRVKNGRRVPLWKDREAIDRMKRLIIEDNNRKVKQRQNDGIKHT